MLSPRHSSHEVKEGGNYTYHWGYFTREVPCTDDPGACAYLDTVYHGHDVSVMYSAIMWGVILGIVLLLFIAHYCDPIVRSARKSSETECPHTGQSALYRIKRMFGAIYHRHFLREALTPIFGHTTRFNILLLAIIVGYLTIFTFVGIVYKTWYSPVEGRPDLRTTRVGLGPWSDRIGILAYALTPLTVLLCTRESLLSLLTGIPYHHFNFLHRWLGWIIYIQSALHTLGWTVIEARLYQPQPETWNEFIGQKYIIWGIVAMIFLTFLVVFSTQWAIRWTGYEFFRKSHYVIAMLYVGACWGHWSKLACWMIASLVVWLLDRSVRLLRTLILHTGKHSSPTHAAWGLHVPKAQMISFPNEEDGCVVRLDFKHDHGPWEIGQHFYLCFPELSVWQSHPMTPSTVPGFSPQNHTYIMRAKKGLTGALANKARTPAVPGELPTTSIVLSGPYGQSIVDHDLHCTDDINLFCIAGGTGVTFVLPLLQAITMTNLFHKRRSQVEFIWVIRRKENLNWIRDEIDALRTVAENCPHFRIRIFITRECGTWSSNDMASTQNKEASIKHTPSSSSVASGEGGAASYSPFTVHYLGTPETSTSSSHPDISSLLTDFLSRTAQGPTRVFASGPTGLVSSLRTTVASCNDPARVLKGNERYDVQLVHDDRLEW
ncbi:ferric reductase like transmembrane component-domain-containing protein [Aspergillus ambiguus]|uniref:ferric reductase family protein n=1 Tax=Aspergillus ambiguus TaxID=176160 RepID=UPI003CCD77DE